MAHKLTNMQAQRVAAGHTIPSLAKRAGIGEATIVRLENGGNADVVATQRIADALGVSLATLGKIDHN